MRKVGNHVSHSPRSFLGAVDLTKGAELDKIGNVVLKWALEEYQTISGIISEFPSCHRFPSETKKAPEA